MSHWLSLSAEPNGAGLSIEARRPQRCEVLLGHVVDAERLAATAAPTCPLLQAACSAAEPLTPRSACIVHVRLRLSSRFTFVVASTRGGQSFAPSLMPPKNARGSTADAGFASWRSSHELDDAICAKSMETRTRRRARAAPPPLAPPNPGTPACASSSAAAGVARPPLLRAARSGGRWRLGPRVAGICRRARARAPPSGGRRTARRPPAARRRRRAAARGGAARSAAAAGRRRRRRRRRPTTGAGARAARRQVPARGRARGVRSRSRIMQLLDGSR